MSVTEAERAVLRTALTEEIGEDSADILMRSTLPQGPDRLATKDDLNALETRVGGEFAKVHGRFERIDGRFERVDGRFAAIHAKMDGGFAAIHAKMDGGFAKVEGKFAERKGHTELLVAQQTRTMLLAMAGFMVTIWVTLIVAFIVLSNQLAAPAEPPPPVAATESLPSPYATAGAVTPPAAP